MDDTCYWCATSIVDVCHCTGNGACGRDSAKEWRRKVGYSLGNKFCVGIVMIADYTICHCGGKKTLNRSEDSNGDSGRHKLLDGLPGHRGNVGFGKFARYGEPVADGFYAAHSGKVLQQ